MKKVRRYFFGILVALMAFALVPGCSGISRIKDIKVTSCGLESYSLRGLRSVDAVLAIGIDNPSFGFMVTDLSGIVKYNGEDVASYTADSIRIDPRCTKVYDLPCTATLGEGISLLQVMRIAGKGSLEGLTTDVEAKVRLKNGIGKTFTFKDLDLKEMMEE